MLHTLILNTPKRVLLETGFIELTIKLIRNQLVEIDYFGLEPDNQADYIDEVMQSKIDSTTIINIYFEQDEIDYSAYSEDDIFNLATNLLIRPEGGNRRVVANEKDIDIYI